eukprot:Lankesteria_metandrocarpae@DN5043_c0_g1_i1.p1
MIREVNIDSAAELVEDVVKPPVDAYFRVIMHTSFGQSVHVTGSVPELGSWNPSQAHRLTTMESCAPCWFSAEPAVLRLGVNVQYKYLIVNQEGNLVEWESNDCNREFRPTGVTTVIEDDDGEYRLRIPLPPKSSPGGLSGDQLGRLRKHELQQLKEQSTYQQHVFNQNDTVFIASVELPVKIVRRPVPVSARLNTEDSNTPAFGTSEVVLEIVKTKFEVVKQSTSFFPLLHQLRGQMPTATTFIGWPGIHPRNDTEKREIETILEEHDCVPVFPPEEQFDEFRSFCRGYLWPCFHNMILMNSGTQNPFRSDLWSSYQAINKRWAEKIVRKASDSDLIWVHDYQMLLVPQYVIRKTRRANVGFFLHIPFPSSEIFRSMPVREEILRGMLCADLVSFQFVEYTRHFLISCKRLLSLEHQFRLGGYLTIDFDGRSVSVKTDHVKIHYHDLRSFVEQSTDVATVSADLRRRWVDKYVFGSVDGCDRLAGLVLKLRAFQSFLRSYPYAKDKVVLVQYAFPVSPGWDNGESLRADLETLAKEINDEFRDSDGNPVLVLNIAEISREKKYAFFLSVNCLLDTSIRDGLNLNPFEYICCRKGKARSRLILSEFTGSSRALQSANRVNPWNTEQIASMMDSVVTGGEASSEYFIWDQNYLQYQSTLVWAQDFLKELRTSRKDDDKLYVSWGFASTFRVLGLDSNFRHLDASSFVLAFRMSRRRVFFFDHEGTLATDRRKMTALLGQDNLFSSGTPPSALVKECLRALAQDSRNTVVILSGREKEMLDLWFNDVPNLGLCAEHGFDLRLPQHSAGVWQKTSPQGDLSWKHVAWDLMEQYVLRTQGSFIENKGSALVFQFRDADPDFGSWQAKELSSHLMDIMFGHPVTVVTGKGYVEVKLDGVNKGNAVKTILRMLKKASATPIDFVSCFGDDRADEEMFAAALERFSKIGDTSQPTSPLGHLQTPPHGSNYTRSTLNAITRSLHSQNVKSPSTLKTSPPRLLSAESRDSSFNAEPDETHVFTVTVGKKPSNAQFFVNDVDEVSELLDALRRELPVAAPISSLLDDHVPTLMRGAAGAWVVGSVGWELPMLTNVAANTE